MHMSKTLSEDAKTAPLKKRKVGRLYLNLIACLRFIHGRNGHPISCIIRDNAALYRTTHTYMRNDYVETPALSGIECAIDNSTVFTIIHRLMSVNGENESKVVTLAGTNNGRACYMALRDYCKGTGVMEKDVKKIENFMQTIFCCGERKPTMW